MYLTESPPKYVSPLLCNHQGHELHCNSMWEPGALTLGTAFLQPAALAPWPVAPEVLHTPLHAALMQASKHSQEHDDVRTGKLPAHQEFSPDVSQLKYERSEGVVKGLSGWLVAHGLHLDDDVVLQGVRELVASKHDLLVLVQLPAHVRDTSVLLKLAQLSSAHQIHSHRHQR